MPELRIVLDPEREGFGIEYQGQVIHLGNDAEIVITGLPDGMAPGPDGQRRASMAFAFKLPTGDLVVAEHLTRELVRQHERLLARLELDVVLVGLDLHPGEVGLAELPEERGVGGREEPPTCLDARARVLAVEAPPAVAALHWRKKHPRLEMPPIPEFPGLN